MLSVLGFFGPSPPPKWNRVAFAGMQLKQLGTLSASSPFYSATPTIVPGHEWVLQLKTSENAEDLLALSDGTASYSGSSARQTWLNAIYNRLLRDWYDTTEAGDYFTIAVNDVTPTQTGTVPAQAWFTNIAITPLILSDYVSDADDAESSIAFTGLSITGLSIASAIYNSGQPNERTVKQIEGTPSTPGSGTISLTATDPWGKSVAISGFAYTITAGIQVPTVDEGSTQYLDAVDELTTAGLTTVQLIPQDNAATVGIVFDQSPAGGTYVVTGTPVVLYVSGIEVPDVVGETLVDAQTALTAAGFSGTPTYVRTSNYTAGTVISQTPAADTVLLEAQVVALTIARAYPISIVKTESRRQKRFIA